VYERPALSRPPVLREADDWLEFLIQPVVGLNGGGYWFATNSSDKLVEDRLL
jgi:hypothetical protein